MNDNRCDGRPTQGDANHPNLCSGMASPLNQLSNHASIAFAFCWPNGHLYVAIALPCCSSSASLASQIACTRARIHPRDDQGDIALVSDDFSRKRLTMPAFQDPSGWLADICGSHLTSLPPANRLMSG